MIAGSTSDRCPSRRVTPSVTEVLVEMRAVGVGGSDVHADVYS
jgi:hypothetical protein